MSVSKAIIASGLMMIEKVVEFNRNSNEVFENLETNDSLLINHVVMKPGQKFPSHETEAIIYIIINTGEISIKLNDQPEHIYSKGSMVELPAGVQSGLSNSSSGITELFVVKSRIK